MALFESYERRIDKINSVLNSYGIASIEEAEKYIQEAIYEKMGGWDEVVATCIGHTHIDVAWLWTIDQVRQKSCRSFATVLKLMEEYPNYHFMSSQPKLYSFVKERHPEVYEKIRQRVKCR